MAHDAPAKTIRDRRLAAGLTQELLAAEAGVCTMTVSRAERSGRLSPATAARLAPFLGCEPADLLPPSRS